MQAATETSQQRKSEALKRLRVVEAFRDGLTQNRKQTGMGSDSVSASCST